MAKVTITIEDTDVGFNVSIDFHGSTETTTATILAKLLNGMVENPALVESARLTSIHVNEQTKLEEDA